MELIVKKIVTIKIDWKIDRISSFAYILVVTGKDSFIHWATLLALTIMNLLILLQVWINDDE